MQPTVKGMATILFAAAAFGAAFVANAAEEVKVTGQIFHFEPEDKKPIEVRLLDKKNYKVYILEFDRNKSNFSGLLNPSNNRKKVEVTGNITGRYLSFYKLKVLSWKFVTETATGEIEKKPVAPPAPAAEESKKSRFIASVSPEYRRDTLDDGDMSVNNFGVRAGAAIETTKCGRLGLEAWGRIGSGSMSSDIHESAGGVTADTRLDMESRTRLFGAEFSMFAPNNRWFQMARVGYEYEGVEGRSDTFTTINMGGPPIYSSVTGKTSESYQTVAGLFEFCPISDSALKFNEEGEGCRVKFGLLPYGSYSMYSGDVESLDNFTGAEFKDSVSYHIIRLGGFGHMQMAKPDGQLSFDILGGHVSSDENNRKDSSSQIFIGAMKYRYVIAAPLCRHSSDNDSYIGGALAFTWRKDNNEFSGQNLAAAMLVDELRAVERIGLTGGRTPYENRPPAMLADTAVLDGRYNGGNDYMFRAGASFSLKGLNVGLFGGYWRNGDASGVGGGVGAGFRF